jgi:malate dehydrogenase (oxaloacetate-decarboxylating)(NADP+)
MNACEISGRKIEDLRIVVNGAGASAIACTKMFVSLGAQKSNILMCDSTGVIYKGRKEGMNKYKDEFAVETERRTLSEALVNADVFVGLSVAGAVTGEMIMPMAKNPIIFAMANPDPEITPDQARAARPDVMIATGRSDYPNQVNNVLGFPSIFRGALDTRATQINEEMKKAAVMALAKLAREDVPDKVSASYGGKRFKFGPDYLIPKPFDPRVLLWVAPAVAEAAMKSGVAQIKIDDLRKYRDGLEAIQGPSKVFIRQAIDRVRSNSAANNGVLPKIVFPEGSSTKILKALRTLVEEDICQPILLGYPDQVKEKIHSLGLENLDHVSIVHPRTHPRFDEFCQALYEKRCRKGVTQSEAIRLMADPNYFAAMMVELGEADGLVTGSSQNYEDAVKPVLQIIGVGHETVAAGLNLVLLEDRMVILADTTVNIDPTAEQLAQIGIQCAQVMEFFHEEPSIAMLSFSNFTGRQGTPAKMKRATEIINARKPNLICDGDMQADTAVNPDIVERIFPFCEIKDGANILIFPNLDASNISYKLLQQLGKGEVIGPFLIGIRNSANVLQRTTTVDGIINSVVLTALEAQHLQQKRKKKQ